MTAGGHLSPDTEQSAGVARAPATVVVDDRAERSLERDDDVGERDLGRRSCEDVPAAAAAPAGHQAGSCGAERATGSGRARGCRADARSRRSGPAGAGPLGEIHDRPDTVFDSSR